MYLKKYLITYYQVDPFPPCNKYNPTYHLIQQNFGSVIKWDYSKTKPKTFVNNVSSNNNNSDVSNYYHTQTLGFTSKHISTSNLFMKKKGNNYISLKKMLPRQNSKKRENLFRKANISEEIRLLADNDDMEVSETKNNMKTKLSFNDISTYNHIKTSKNSVKIPGPDISKNLSREKRNKALESKKMVFAFADPGIKKNSPSKLI